MTDLKFGAAKNPPKVEEVVPVEPSTFEDILPMVKKPEELIVITKFYKSIRKTVSRNLVEELLLTLNNSGAIVKKLRELIDRKLAKTNLTDEDIIMLITAQEKLVDIANGVPKQIEALKKTEAIVELEEGEEIEIGRGGKIIKDSMNPNKALC